MLFSGEEGLKPTEALSGGETARLLFCRIILKPNVLILDEPTNHLDLRESINRPQRGAAEVRRHGPARDPRPGSTRGSRHTRVALRGRGDRGLQGHVRGAHRHDRIVAITPRFCALRFGRNCYGFRCLRTYRGGDRRQARQDATLRRVRQDWGALGRICAPANHVGPRSAATRRRTSTRPNTPAPLSTRSWRQRSRESAGSTAIQTMRWRNTETRWAA